MSPQEREGVERPFAVVFSAKCSSMKDNNMCLLCLKSLDWEMKLGIAKYSTFLHYILLLYYCTSKVFIDCWMNVDTACELYCEWETLRSFVVVFTGFKSLSQWNLFFARSSPRYYAGFLVECYSGSGRRTRGVTFYFYYQRNWILNVLRCMFGILCMHVHARIWSNNAWLVIVLKIICNGTTCRTKTHAISFRWCVSCSWVTCCVLRSLFSFKDF
jgi:hypothetical protein